MGMSICLLVCLSVCLSFAKMQKRDFLKNYINNLRLWCLLTTYRKSYIGFSKNPLLDPKNPRWRRSAILKIDMTSFFLRRVVRFGYNFAHWCRMTCRLVIWSKSKPEVEFQYGGRLGEFNGMLSQSHVSLCRVLTHGELTVTIPEPHLTLQGAVTWRNQCHDRATLQGVRIPSAILKIVLRHTFICFLNTV